MSSLYRSNFIGCPRRNKMSSSVVNTFLVLFILPFLPITGAIRADKSRLSRWFDSTYGAAKWFDSTYGAAKEASAVVKVRADGGGDFKTVSDAINSIPSGNKQRVVVWIGAGNYTEKISIPSDKPYVTLYGDPNDMPFLVFAGTAEKYGTVDSATLTADSDHFMAVNLKIVNSAPRPDGKTGGSQAVALRVGGDAAAFYNCKVYGFQDTLFDYNGRHFFKDCYIEGTVDFIFGGGRSIYMNTEIHVIPGDPLTFITAHARSADSEATGFVFLHCLVTGSGQTAFLGRSWFLYARVVFAYSTLSDVVNPLGWSNNMHPESNRTVFFGEFENVGPGSKFDKRVTFAKKLNGEEAKPFTQLDFIQASSWLQPPPKL